MKIVETRMMGWTCDETLLVKILNMAIINSLGVSTTIRNSIRVVQNHKKIRE